MSTDTTNKNESNDEKKVFDVAKPGSSNPDTGTKPMVIGHKSIKSDLSMLKKDDETNDGTTDESTKDESTIELNASKKLTIKPLSKEESESSKSPEEQEGATVTTTHEEKASATEETATKSEEETEKTVADAEKDKQTAAVEREARLKELVKNGTYTLSINESKSYNFKVFITTFLLTSVVAIAGLVILLDLEIIDFGYSLPFDIL